MLGNVLSHEFINKGDFQMAAVIPPKGSKTSHETIATFLDKPFDKSIVTCEHADTVLNGTFKYTRLNHGLKLTNHYYLNGKPMLPIPRAPIFHPYNPNDNAIYDAGIPKTILTMKCPIQTLSYLPTHVKAALTISPLYRDYKGIEVFFVTQTKPWHERSDLLIRPHYWVHGDEDMQSRIDAGPFNEATRCLIGLFLPCDDAQSPLCYEGTRNAFNRIIIHSHRIGHGMVVSSPEARGKLSGLHPSRTESFYSVVITSRKIAVTLHWVLSPLDQECLEALASAAEVTHFRELIIRINNLDKTTLNRKNGPLADLMNLFNIDIPSLKPQLPLEDKKVPTKEKDEHPETAVSTLKPTVVASASPRDIDDVAPVDRMKVRNARRHSLFKLLIVIMTFAAMGGRYYFLRPILLYGMAFLALFPYATRFLSIRTARATVTDESNCTTSRTRPQPTGPIAKPLPALMPPIPRHPTSSAAAPPAPAPVAFVATIPAKTVAAVAPAAPRPPAVPLVQHPVVLPERVRLEGMLEQMIVDFRQLSYARDLSIRKKMNTIKWLTSHTTLMASTDRDSLVQDERKKLQEELHQEDQEIADFILRAGELRIKLSAELTQKEKEMAQDELRNISDHLYTFPTIEEKINRFVFLMIMDLLRQVDPLLVDLVKEKRAAYEHEKEHKMAPAPAPCPAAPAITPPTRMHAAAPPPLPPAAPSDDTARAKVQAALDHHVNEFKNILTTAYWEIQEQRMALDNAYRDPAVLDQERSDGRTRVEAKEKAIQKETVRFILLTGTLRIALSTLSPTEQAQAQEKLKVIVPQLYTFPQAEDKITQFIFMTIRDLLWVVCPLALTRFHEKRAEHEKRVASGTGVPRPVPHPITENTAPDSDMKAAPSADAKEDAEDAEDAELNLARAISLSLR